MTTHLHRLRAEVASDLGAFEAHVEDLLRLDLNPDTASRAVLAQAAVALHHAYGAIEAALARVARTLEGSVPAGPDWHNALLESMALDMPPVRPAVLSVETAGLLRRLLAFRHFFRHAYTVAWDPVRMADLKDTALAVRPLVRADLARLDALLVKLSACE